MKFRFHKGRLAESMATQFEFKNKQDLINKINEYYGFNCVDEKTFKCSFYCYDERIKENTHIVERYENKKNHWVIGMADCMVNDEQLDKTNEKIKRLEQALAEIKSILELYANSKVGEEQSDGTYKLSSGLCGIQDSFGFCITTYDPRPAKQALQKISEVEDADI